MSWFFIKKRKDKGFIYFLNFIYFGFKKYFKCVFGSNVILKEFVFVDLNYCFSCFEIN